MTIPTDADKNAPACVDHGEGIWTITYDRNPPEALVYFKKRFPDLLIRSFDIENTGYGSKKIYLDTERKCLME